MTLKDDCGSRKERPPDPRRDGAAAFAEDHLASLVGGGDGGGGPHDLCVLLNFRDAWPADAGCGGGDGGVGCARALAAVRAAAAACNGADDGDRADDGPPAEVAALTTSLMDGRGLADQHSFVALLHLARARSGTCGRGPPAWRGVF